MRRSWFMLLLAACAAGCSILTDVSGLSGTTAEATNAGDAGGDAGVDGDASQGAAGDRYGNGHGGARSLLSGAQVLNEYRNPLADIPAGAALPSVEEPASFGVGSLVLIHRTSGLSSAPRGAASVSLYSNELAPTFSAV